MAAPIAQVSGYFRQLHRTLKQREEASATESYFARAAAGSLGLRAASLGLGFICHLVLTRSLGAHAYGIYAYALAWVMTLSVPAMLGLERLLVRDVAVYRARSDWASWHGLLVWAGRMLLVVASGIALVAVAVSWLAFGSTEALQAFWLAMVLLPLLSLLRFKQSVMQGMHRAVVGQIPEVLVQPLLLTALVAVYFASGARLTATGAMALNVLATSAALACGVVLLERSLPASVKKSAPRAQPRMWMRSAMPLLVVSGVNVMSGQIPVLMLGAMQSAEAAGIMSVAKRLSDLTIFPSIAMSAVLTPTLVALWTTRDVCGLQRAVTKCARWVTLVSLPLALALILFGHPLLGVFGSQFIGGAAALSLLCIGQIVNMCVGSIGLLLMMTGHEREVAFISTACALLNFGFCALLIPRWGMAGAAASATTSLIVWNLWLAWCVRRRLDIRPTIFARVVNRQHEAS